MEILKTDEFIAINEMAMSQDMPAIQYDFFSILKDTHSYSFAHCVYANALNSKLAAKINDGGTLIPNPLKDNCWSVTTYRFRVKEEYNDTALRKDPALVLGTRKGFVDKVKDIPGVDLDKDGNCRIMLTDPKVIDSRYYMRDDKGNIVEVDKADLLPYFKPSSIIPKPSSSGTDAKLLKYHKLYSLSAGHEIRYNEEFIYPDLIPFIKKLK